jgi:hypothetical protein
MADLEEHALKRDKKFLLRMVLGLLTAAIFGFIIASQLTSDAVGTCAARGFNNVAPAPGSPPP